MISHHFVLIHVVADPSYCRTIILKAVMESSSSKAKSSADVIVMHSVVSYALASILDGIVVVGGKPIKDNFQGHRPLMPLRADPDSDDDTR